MVEYLLKQGVQPDEVGHSCGSTALHAAAYYDRTDVVHALLNATPRERLSSFLSRTNTFGGTAASETTIKAIAAMLDDALAKANAWDKRRAQAEKVLGENTAKAPVYSRSDKNQLVTLADIALTITFPERLTLLERCDAAGCTPLCVAAEMGNRKVCS